MALFVRAFVACEATREHGGGRGSDPRGSSLSRAGATGARNWIPRSPQTWLLVGPTRRYEFLRAPAPPG